jgi:hypothetical protein
MAGILDGSDVVGGDLGCSSWVSRFNLRRSAAPGVRVSCSSTGLTIAALGSSGQAATTAAQSAQSLTMAE